MRGNVGTRLAKLDQGDYDAIVLASSGLIRLGLDQRICHRLDIATSLPAVGQGVLAIECRDESSLVDKLSVLDHSPTRLCATAERAMNHTLEGGCQVPIAGFATLADDTLHLQGRVGTQDGTIILKASQSVPLANTPNIATTLGKTVAQHLLQQGAQAILQNLSLGV